MKKVYLIWFLFTLSFPAIIAQTPSQFKYQAVLRDASGNILADQSVTVDIAILEGSATGPSVFDEIHNVTTSAQGVINLSIGSVNDMGTIDWAKEIYFVEITVNGTLMGTSQLLGVPYAMVAKKAMTANYEKLLNLPVLFDGYWSSLIGTPTTIEGYGITDAFSGNYSDLINQPTLFSGSFGDLSNMPTTINGYGITDAFTGDYNELNNKPDINTTPNISIGPGAGENALSDRNIIAVGNSALYNNGVGATQSHHGNDNIGIGFQALFSNTLGWNNTACGMYSLYLNSSGNNNVAFGYQSLYNNSTGRFNTSIGVNSLNANTTGSSNTSNGYQSLYSNTTGENNTSNGTESLYYNSIGSGNTAVGIYSLRSNSTGDFNTSYGHGALQRNTTGYSNVAVGVRALYRNTTKSNLVAIGDSALFYNGLGTTEVSHATGNTAVGSKALFLNNTGYRNTANGYHALYSNTTGRDNTASGYEALRSNTTGVLNTAVGYNALQLNTTGVVNTASGRHALGSNTTGTANTAIGGIALFYNVSGNHNTAFGYYSGPSEGSTNLTNTGAFGSSATVTASNTIRIGNSSITSVGGYAAWSNLSDGRFKTNVKQNVSGLDFIMKLKSVTYNWDLNKLESFYGGLNNNLHQSEIMKKARIEKETKTYTGFIAQEVEKAAIECGFDFSGIVKPANDKSHYNLSYAEFVVPIVKAIQEQQEIIMNQQKEIQKLKKEIAEINNTAIR